MITRKDILDAIAKCQEQKNPSSNTCIKLASYYTILDHMLESEHSYSGRQTSEYLDIVRDKSKERVMLIMNDLMDEIQATDPQLYNSTITKLNSL